MAKEKKEGILSRWFRQRTEEKEAEETKPTSEGAGSFGSSAPKEAAAAYSAAQAAKVKAAQAAAEAHEDAAKLEAQKEKARKDLEAAQARIEEAKTKIRSKAEAEKAEAEMQALKEKAQKELAEQQAKIEAARAAIRAQRRTYTVKPGDSLSVIAKQFYGKASQWPKIYEANKDIIGDNPDLIHPGQEFVIPDED